jgi:gluconolactonase
MGAPELVQNGYGFTEGPLWIPSRGVLIFSDLDQNRLYELTPPNTFNVFREPSNVGNGNALDIRGRLLTCEHGSRSLVRGTVAGGATSRVASMFEGRGLNSPNDVTVRSDGLIYFTDPPYGGIGQVGFNGLYRLVESPAGAQLYAEWRGNPDSRPNGVIFSPDERFLYMADTAADEIMMFDVALGGALANPRTFARTGVEPDGMGIDSAGNLYIAVMGGIEAFALNGTRWGLIPMARTPSNVAWGDADRQTLYITAGPELYRLRMPFAGVRD